MPHRSWFTAPRYLLVLFLATGTLLVCTLLWFGWQLARQDRDLVAQRLQERRDNVLDRAVAALQRSLTEADERVAALQSALGTAGFDGRAAKFAATLPADCILVILNQRGFVAYPATRLPFYPDLAIATLVSQSVFSEADALEFRSGDHVAALAALIRASRAKDLAVRAAALVRVAAIHRRHAQWQAALDVYRDLDQLGDTPVEGVPAELLARHARLTIYADQQRRPEAHAEAGAIAAGLQQRRWRLSRGAREFYETELARLGQAGVTVDGEDAGGALATAVELLATDLRPNSEAALRRIVRADNRSLLSLVRTTSAGSVALVLGPSWLDLRLAADVGAAMTGQGVRVGLTDAEGHDVLATPGPPTPPQTVRLATATGLPWNVYAVTSDPGSAQATSAARGRLIATGLGAITLLFLAGIALIGRAVTRELAVSRQQSDFVSSVSHEFRTPLSSLCLLSEMLQSGRVADEEQRRDYYGVMARESQRLRRLVDGLLNFGRMEAGVMHYQFDTLDPIELARQVCEAFQRDVSSQGYEIDVETRNDTPLVLADRAALSCALWNLLDNAVKYSPECHSVWVVVGRESDCAVIRVRDGGVGIAAREQSRIFDKFVRGRDAERAGTVGTGVGLALVRHIVTAHKGRVTVESESGKGSVFSIEVPAADEIVP